MPSTIAVAKEFWLPAFNLPWIKNQTYQGLSAVDLFDVYRREFLGRKYKSDQYSSEYYPTLHDHGMEDVQINVPGHNPDAVRTDFYYVITGWDPDYIQNAAVSPQGMLEYKCANNPVVPKNGAYINILMIRK